MFVVVIAEFDLGLFLGCLFGLFTLDVRGLFGASGVSGGFAFVV